MGVEIKVAHELLTLYDTQASNGGGDTVVETIVGSSRYIIDQECDLVECSYVRILVEC